MKWLRLLVGCLVIAAIPFVLSAWTGAAHERGLREVAIPHTVVVSELPVVDPHGDAASAPDTVSRYLALGVGASAVAVLTRSLDPRG